MRPYVYRSYAPTYPESRLFLMLYVLVGFACTGIVAQILNDAVMNSVCVIWSKIVRTCDINAKEFGQCL